MKNLSKLEIDILSEIRDYGKNGAFSNQLKVCSEEETENILQELQKSGLVTRSCETGEVNMADFSFSIVYGKWQITPKSNVCLTEIEHERVQLKKAQRNHDIIQWVLGGTIGAIITMIVSKLLD